MKKTSRFVRFILIVVCIATLCAACTRTETAIKTDETPMQRNTRMMIDGQEIQGPINPNPNPSNTPTPILTTPTPEPSPTPELPTPTMTTSTPELPDPTPTPELPTPVVTPPILLKAIRPSPFPDLNPPIVYDEDGFAAVIDPVSGEEIWYIEGQEPEASEAGRVIFIGFGILNTVGYSSSQQDIVSRNFPEMWLKKFPDDGDLHYLKDTYQHDWDNPTVAYLTAIADSGNCYLFRFDTQYSISTMTVQVFDEAGTEVLSYIP